MQSDTAVIEAKELGRDFGHRRAVESVSLALGAGDCLAVFGPNGAGKTTFLRLLGGILKPSRGSASIRGIQLPGGKDLRRQVGIISHRGMLYEALTARENIEFAARLYGLRSAREAAESALHGMKIEQPDIPVRALSRGSQQRVAIARATVHSPAVVLADEPYTGLDDSGAAALTGLLRALLDRGAAMLIVTHQLGEGLELASEVAVMRAGRIVRIEPREKIDATSFALDYRALVTANV